ncbi:MAG: YrbL family protein [Pseudomonadota bacterium]
MATLDALPDRLTAEMLIYKTRGRDRAVYDIADFPEFLAKVPISDPQRLRRVFAHEARFLRARRVPTLPVARILGHRPTPFGQAQISERIVDRSGALAPTLADLLADDRFTDAHLAALNRFVEDAVKKHIPLSDFAFRNLVYGRRPGEDEDRVFVVDGYGDKSFIQIKRWFGWANAPHVLRKFGRYPPNSWLTWNRRTRRYERI